MKPQKELKTRSSKTVRIFSDRITNFVLAEHNTLNYVD